ncbi:MAG TPA: tautomerase family protein [Micromonospora sp.]|nr:tautomerase family protein [Micromonospora sp.]
MPHVTITCFERDFTDQEKERLAKAVTAAVLENFDTYEGAISVALEPIAESDWQEAVFVPEITGRAHLLIKAPNYQAE